MHAFHRRCFLIDLTNQVTREGHDPVASGGFADIYRGMLRQNNGQPIKVAIKAIKTYSGEDGNFSKKQKRLRREIKVWLNLRHANVLPLFGTTVGFGRFPAMVCPWVENGTLTVYLEDRYHSLSAIKVLGLLDNVASGLRYLHSRSVVHGDLSGSNVLIRENGRACIADFGLSMLLTELGGSTFAASSHARGTLRWTAPELLDLEIPEDGMEEESQRIAPTTQSDVYSFGSIMLQILSGKMPYHYYKREAQVVHAVSRGMKPRRPSSTFTTERRWMFIQQCWSTMDIESRPSSEEIAEFIEEELTDCRTPPEDVEFLRPLLAIQTGSNTTRPHPPLDEPARNGDSIPDTVVEPLIVDRSLLLPFSSSDTVTPQPPRFVSYPLGHCTMSTSNANLGPGKDYGRTYSNPSPDHNLDPGWSRNGYVWTHMQNASTSMDRTLDGMYEAVPYPPRLVRPHPLNRDRETEWDSDQYWDGDRQSCMNDDVHRTTRVPQPTPPRSSRSVTTSSTEPLVAGHNDQFVQVPIIAAQPVSHWQGALSHFVASAAFSGHPPELQALAKQRYVLPVTAQVTVASQTSAGLPPPTSTQLTVDDVSVATRSDVTPGGSRGSNFPQTKENPENIEVLKAWRYITQDPRFKDVDVNTLCTEFAKMARCDGTRIVLEPESVDQLLEQFQVMKLQP
ncbi:kinase-like domain-containing protein [Boletus reticuloceps]|uniref:Kinase-like domain-containing protein n=1 Tax=Boletus reticuloceps TaxID=495285 RepID=A0A8I2YQ51_9AGAM|nr:kinase-like domain-containing protein [Boletus reticuloceps]